MAYGIRMIQRFPAQYCNLQGGSGMIRENADNGHDLFRRKGAALQRGVHTKGFKKLIGKKPYQRGAGNRLKDAAYETESEV